MEGNNSFQDKGWAWVIVFGAFISHYLTAGYEKGYSVLYVEIINKYHTTSAFAAGLNGFSAAVRLLFAPVAVALCNRFTDQVVVMSGGVLCFSGLIMSAISDHFYGVAVGYGLIFGLGLTLVYTPSLTMCTTYFKRKRSTALSLSLSGAGFAALSMPYLVVFLVEKYAYDGAVLLLGAISLHFCVCGALYRKPPLSSTMNPTKYESIPGEKNIPMNMYHRMKKRITSCFATEEQKNSCTVTFKNPWIVLFLFSFCLNMMGSGPVTTLLIHHAETLGYRRMLSVQLLAIEGIVQIVVRVFTGLILDYHRIRPYRGRIWSVTIAFSALIIFFLAFAENMITLSILMSLRGVTLAVYISQQAVITADMCEEHPEHLKQAIGMAQIGKGVGVLLGSWCAGAIRDVTEEYRPAFIFLSIMQLIGSLIALIAVINVHRNTCAHDKSDVQDTLYESLDPSQCNQSELTASSDNIELSAEKSRVYRCGQSDTIAVKLSDKNVFHDRTSDPTQCENLERKQVEDILPPCTTPVRL